jgi:hypothetical protein
MPGVSDGVEPSVRPPATATTRDSLANDLRESPTTVYPLIAVAMLVAWLPASAAYSPAVYCAGALGVLILIVATAAGGISSTMSAAPARWIAIGAALSFALWNYASIGWAEDTGIAFDGANRTALYAGLFVLFALTSWTPRLVYLAVGAYATGAVTISAVEFVRAVHSQHPENEFISGRLTVPAGYENASAAILLTAVLVSVIVASRPGLPPLVRMLMFAVATAGTDLAILAQSRGSLLGASVAVPVLLLLAPSRHRILATLIAIGACVFIAAPAMLNVYVASDHGFNSFDHALHRSLRMAGYSVVAAAIVGLAWSFAVRRLPSAPRGRRYADRAVSGLVIVALLSPLIVAGVRPHLARHAVRSAWHSFAHGGSPTGGGTRLSSLGSSRYDFYRVTLREIKAHPVLGVGSDNFAIDYLRSRRTDEEPLYPHSDILRIPAQTGLVGTLLALIFAASVCVAAYRSWRAVPTATLALLIPVVYWLCQGSFDWLWEVAGVTAPLAACAGAAVSLRRTTSAPRRVPVLARVVVTLAALAFAVPIAADWISGHDINTALAQRNTDPLGAIHELHRASVLNPFSDGPDLFAAAIAGRIGARDVMAVQLHEAERRNPDNWYTHLLLAVLAADSRSWNVASTQAAAAARLNPLESTIADVQRSVRKRHPPRLQTVEAVFLQRAAKRVRSGVTH